MNSLKAVGLQKGFKVFEGMSHDLLASVTHDESRVIDLPYKHDNKINGYIQPSFPIQDNSIWIGSTLIRLHG